MMSYFRKDDFWMGLAVYVPCVVKPGKQDYLPYIWSDCTLFDDTAVVFAIEDVSRRRNNENCFQVRRSDRLWKFKKCSENKPFICEIPMTGMLFYLFIYLFIY